MSALRNPRATYRIFGVTLAIACAIAAILFGLGSRLERQGKSGGREVAIGAIKRAGAYIVEFPVANESLPNEQPTGMHLLIGFEENEFQENVVPHLAALPEVSALVASGKSVDDRAAVAISTIATLKMLELRATGITDAGAKAFLSNRDLERLVLSHCAVGDEGVEVIAKLAKLRELDVRGSNVGDAGMNAIIEHSSTLTALDVSQTKVTTEGVEKARRVRPDIVVTWEP
jgi:hypothetical protein